MVYSTSTPEHPTLELDEDAVINGCPFLIFALFFVFVAVASGIYLSSRGLFAFCRTWAAVFNFILHSFLVRFIIVLR